jgi:hypothetical protein
LDYIAVLPTFAEPPEECNRTGKWPLQRSRLGCIHFRGFLSLFGPEQLSHRFPIISYSKPRLSFLSNAHYFVVFEPGTLKDFDSLQLYLLHLR